MQHDEVIWQVINPGFCSFKVKTKEKIQNFCKNPNNLTGLCNRSSCPLANSRYATIHEDKGVCYLWMKTIERAHSPLNMWEKIKLPRNYTAALAIIDQQLQYWPKFIIHKAKQRLTRIHQYLIRMRRLKLKVMPKIVGITKKTERREATREAKALKAARLSDAITQELVQRLQEGTYEGFISFPQKEYEKALNVVGESQEEEEVEEGDEQDEVEGEMEHELDLEGLMEGADGEKLDLDDADEFVEAFGDDEDLEDFPGGEGGEDDGEDAEEESKDSKEEAKPKRPKRAHTPSSTASAPTSKRRPAGGSAPGGRRARLEVEYEVEHEKDQATAQE